MIQSAITQLIHGRIKIHFLWKWSVQQRKQLYQYYFPQDASVKRYKLLLLKFVLSKLLKFHATILSPWFHPTPRAKSADMLHMETFIRKSLILTPNRFHDVKVTLEWMGLRIIAESIPDIGRTALQAELVSFASSYNYLQKGLLLTENDCKTEIDDKIGKQSFESRVKEKACKNCLSCAFKSRLCSAAFYAAHKYLITLSISQCTCECIFSKLMIKSRLRLMLKQRHLESLILIAVEKEIVCRLTEDKEGIIKRIACCCFKITGCQAF